MEESIPENLVFLLGFSVRKEGGGSSCYASLVANEKLVGVVSSHLCLYGRATH